MVYVLCLPGALGTIWTVFQPQVKGFDRGKFTLVECRQKQIRNSMKTSTRPTLTMLLNALRFLRYSVLGWSDGGSTSLILAARYQAAVQKLVIWGTNSFILPNEIDLYKTTYFISIFR
nr:valacyclovir hydrolase-like [Plodia interpunctella]